MNKDMTNTDVMKSQWQQFRGQAKIWWGKLTEDDLDQINGERERLISKLQERYGYKREQAIHEVDRHLKDLEQVTLPTR